MTQEQKKPIAADKRTGFVCQMLRAVQTIYFSSSLTGPQNGEKSGSLSRIFVAVCA